jgi:hypothetical protein
MSALAPQTCVVKIPVSGIDGVWRKIDKFLLSQGFIKLVSNSVSLTMDL